MPSARGALIEVQQNSDVTYRLYDYGRPRELHLDQGIAVARAEPFSADLVRAVDPGGSNVLLECKTFTLAHIAGQDLGPLDAAVGQVTIVPINETIEINKMSVAPEKWSLSRPVSDGFVRGMRALWSRGALPQGDDRLPIDLHPDCIVLRGFNGPHVGRIRR